MLKRNLNQMLKRRGQEATLRKVVYGSYDTSTGSQTGTNTDYTVKMYFASFEISELDSDNISLGDRKVLISTEDTSGATIPEPDAEDIIVGVGDKSVIKSVQKLYNADTLVCYICHVRS